MSDCIFCKIINKEIPSNFVYEDDSVIAINDLNPQADTHVLVIPKTHVTSLAELEDEELMVKLLKGVKATAKKLGISPEMVFKTIVMRTDSKEICVFCQSSMCEINLKKARQAAGASEINPVKPEELLALTGYVRGGCSPLGMRRQYRTFIDSQALDFEEIYISAGVRGQNIIISPAD